MSDTPKQDFYAQSLVEQLSVDPEAWQCARYLANTDAEGGHHQRSA